jgi:probable rRNA maturation factor
MVTDVQYACSREHIPETKNIRTWVAAAVPASRLGAELTVRFVDVDESRDLNSQFRHQDKPTNVLSFPADLPPGVAVNLLGDIVVCAPVALAEAVEQNKSARAHFAHLVVHGTLHLLGYDHVDDAQAMVMEGLERTILAELGFSDPYLVTKA